MNTLKQLKRIKKIHKRIAAGNTGKPKEFAETLNISERELYRILDYVKDLGAQISFSRKQNSYYYLSDFDLLINVSLQVLVGDELKTIYAGKTTLGKSLATQFIAKNKKISYTDIKWQ